MNLIIAARKDLVVTKIPGDISVCLYTIKKGDQLRITGITHIGLDRVYNVHGGGYVSVKDVQILRDNDFYNSSISDRNTRSYLMKSNLSTCGGHGLSAIIGKTNNLTDNWFDLQSFASTSSISLGTTKYTQISTNIHDYDLTSGGGFGGAIGNRAGITLSGSDLGKYNPSYEERIKSMNTVPLIPTSDNKSTTATVNPDTYSDNILNMNVTTAITGIGNNTVIGGLLRGVKIGNFTDGTAGTKLLANALGMLSSWAFNKLKFVIGFDLTASLSALLQAFGTSWASLIKTSANSLFGSTFATSFLSGIGKYGDYQSTTGNVQSVSSWTGYGVKFFDVKAGEGDRFTFKYADVTQEMMDFFKYKGCNGQMIVKTYAGLTWEQDAYYYTPELESRKDEEEVQMWKNLYNADYSDFEKPLDLIKSELNLNVERKTLFTCFNRYRAPVPDHELNMTRAYIIFTRPDLNLTMTDSRHYIRPYPLFGNIMKSHSVLASYLMGSAAGVNHEFFPVLTHCCTGIEVADEVLETVEHGETFVGWKFNYGTSLIKSKTAGTVTVTFRDDDMLSIYKIMKVWCEYINAVYRGEGAPKEEYLSRHQLDYAISIYYFLCKANEAGDILFWTKYTGAFPTAIPSSNFADSLGSPVKQPTYSIPFIYARKDDYNPLHIAEFNNLSSGPYEYLPNYNPETLRVNTSFVGAPFIDTNDGSQLFKLKFRPAGK